MGEKQQNLNAETSILHDLKADIDACTEDDYKKKVKALKRALRENYVKRGLVKKIIAAWIITVPAAAGVSAIIFFVLKGLVL
jgi:PiT family inorganic phosphate transporter